MPSDLHLCSTGCEAHSYVVSVIKKKKEKKKKRKQKRTNDYKAKSVPKAGEVEALAWNPRSQEAVAQDCRQLEGILGYSQFKTKLKVIRFLL